MPPIRIEILVDDNGTFSVIDQAVEKLAQLDRVANESAGGVDGMGQSMTDLANNTVGASGNLDDADQKLSDIGRTANESSGHIQVFGKNLLDLKAGFDTITQAVSTAGGMIEDMDKLGMASIRAKAGLDAMSGGQTETYLEGMRSASRGLVTDMDLAKDATFALSTGVAKSSDEMSTIAHDGEVLGEIFSGSAQQGVQDFTRSLEMVGQTRPLRSLGIDAQAVKKEFEQLKSTMSDQDAWKTAIFDVAGKQVNKLGDAADKATSQLEILQTRFDNFKASAGENIAIGVNATINLGKDVSDAGDKGNPVVQGMEAAVLGTIMQVITRGNGAETAQAVLPALQARSGALNAANPAQADPFDTMIENAKAGRKQADLSNFKGGELAPQPYEPPPTPDYDKDMRREQAGLRQSYTAKQDNAWRDRTQDLSQFAQAVNEASQSTSSDFDLMAAKFNNPALFAGLDKLQAQATQFKTIKDAFKLDNGGIGGELSAGMGGVEQKARSAFQNQEREKGISGQEYQADLSHYDQSAKEAMDQYAIATGQATEASIAFNDARAKLDSGAASGQITMDQYSQGLLALADAAASGKTSVEDIAKVMQSIPGADKIQDIAVKYKSMKDAFNLDNGGIGGELTGGLQGAIQQREGHLKGGAKEKFDADAKQAMDDYMIATGQATKESIMFKDQIDSVYAGIASGKVSVKDGTNEILALSNAMSQGATNAADLFRIMGQARDLPGQVRALGGMVQQAFAQGGPGAAAGTGAAGVIDMGLGVVADLAGAGPGKPGAGAGKPVDPYQALKKGVDDYNGSIAATPDIATKAGKATSDALSKTLDVALKVSAGHANDLASGISAIAGSIRGLSGTLTTVVTFTQGGGGSGNHNPGGVQQPLD